MMTRIFRLKFFSVVVLLIYSGKAASQVVQDLCTNDFSLGGSEVDADKVITPVPGEFPIGDEEVLTDFRVWGRFCCNRRASTFDVLHESRDEGISCNNLDNARNGLIQFRVAKTTSTDRVCRHTAYFELCEISVNGSLVEYLDRRRACTYQPVLTLTCDLGESASNSLDTGRVRFVDTNTAPQWNLPELIVEISELTSPGTLVLDPRQGLLSVRESNDIWGSSQWTITLDVQTPLVTLDPRYTVDADPTLPPQQEQTLPALRLTGSIPYSSCQNLEPPCTFEVNIVAADGGGLSSSTKLTLIVLDENNLPPAFPASQVYQQISVDEDEQDVLRLPQVNAIDQDTGINCPVVYSLDQQVEGFTIDSRSGQIQHTTGPFVWSADDRNTYVLVVRAWEEESAGTKCSSSMFALATVVVTVSSKRALQLEVSTDPSPLVARMFAGAAEILGSLVITRNDTRVPNTGFRFVLESNQNYAISPEGVISKNNAVILLESESTKLSIFDQRNRLLTTWDLIVFVREPRRPTFLKPFYHRDVYEGDTILIVSELRDQLQECDQGCPCFVLNTDVTSGPELDSDVGEFTSSVWTAWVARSGRYRSTFQVSCGNALSLASAVTILEVNWHPAPAFDSQPAILVPEGTDSNTALGFLKPTNGFPYAVFFAFPEESPFDIENRTGKITWFGPSEFDKEPVHDAIVTAFESGRPELATSVLLRFQIVETVVPAVFDSEKAVTAGCDDTITIPVKTGSERVSSLTVSAVGGYSQCVEVISQNDFEAVTVSSKKLPQCGEFFSVVVVLQGNKSLDIVTVAFTGCPPAPEPAFVSQSIEFDIYSDDQLPRQLPQTSVSFCPDCSCTVALFSNSSSGSDITFDETSGTLTVNSFPNIDFEEEMYRWPLTVSCRSASSPMSNPAFLSVILNWHPAPQMAPLDVITVSEDATAGTVIATLRPLHRFPYALEYEVVSDVTLTSVSFAVLDGQLVVAGFLNFTVRDEHTFGILAYEASHRDSGQTLPVRVEIVEVIVPARFNTNNYVGLPCDGSAVSVGVDSGRENFDSLVFTVISGNPECIAPLEFDSPSSTATVRASQNLGCGENFTVVLMLEGARSEDVIVLQFTGCSVEELDQPYFTEPFKDVHLFEIQFQPTVFSSGLSCRDCTCEMEKTALSPDIPEAMELNTTNGDVFLRSWPAEGLNSSSTDEKWADYKLSVLVVCTSLRSASNATSAITFNWHPTLVIVESNNPSEMPVVTLELSDSTPVDFVTNVSLKPKDPKYPYPLLYYLNSRALRVEEDGRVVTSAPITENEEPVVTIHDRRTLITVASVRIRLVVRREYGSPTFFGDLIERIPCGEQRRVPVSLGSEPSVLGLNITLEGPGARCVRSERTEAAFVVSAEPTGLCGDTFSALLVLQGATGVRSIVLLEFTGCASPPTSSPTSETSSSSPESSSLSQETTESTVFPPVTTSSSEFTSSVTFSTDANTGSSTGESTDSTAPSSTDISSSSSSTAETTRVSVDTDSTGSTGTSTAVPDAGTSSEVSSSSTASSDSTTSSTVNGSPDDTTSPSSLSSDSVGSTSTPQTDSTTVLQDDSSTTACAPADTDIPVFMQVLREIHVYRLDSAPASFSNYLSCRTCVCQMGSGSQNVPPVIEVNRATGEVTILEWPTNGLNGTTAPPDQWLNYRSTILISCTSTTSQTTSAMLVINWHPEPVIGEPISGYHIQQVDVVLPDNTPVGTVTAISLKPKNNYPYPVEYRFTLDTPFPLAVDTEGRIRTTAALTASGTASVDIWDVTSDSGIAHVSLRLSVTVSGVTDPSGTTGPQSTVSTDPSETSAASTSDSTVSSASTESSTLPTTTPSTPPPLLPPGEINIFSGYIGNFNESAKQFFDFDAPSEELHFKDIPEPGTSYRLNFLRKSARQTRAISVRAEDDYVITVRMNHQAKVLAEPPSTPPATTGLSTWEIVLIVVGALLLIAIVALIGGAMKMRKYQKEIRQYSETTPETPPQKPLDRPITVVTTPPTISSARGSTVLVGSVRESQVGTVRSRVMSLRGAEPELDRLGLVENASLNESTDSPPPFQEPSPPAGEPVPDRFVYDHIPRFEIPMEEPVVEREEEPVNFAAPEEPEPDYNVFVPVVSPIPPPPPPPPPPVETPPPATPLRRNVSSERELEPTQGERFLEELKSVVGDPYKVLRPLDEEVSSAQETDRKVRFDAAVEVIQSGATSHASSPGPVRSPSVKTIDEINSPPLPAYSPMLSHNLGKNTTLVMPSPPSPAYVSPLKIKSPEAHPVESPKPPVYKSAVLTGTDSFKSAKEPENEEEEIVSRRQISKEKISAPPPPPPLITPLLGEEHGPEGGEEGSDGDAESVKNDEDRTAL